MQTEWRLAQLEQMVALAFCVIGRRTHILGQEQSLWLMRGVCVCASVCLPFVLWKCLCWRWAKVIIQENEPIIYAKT